MLCLAKLWVDSEYYSNNSLGRVGAYSYIHTYIPGTPWVGYATFPSNANDIIHRVCLILLQFVRWVSYPIQSSPSFLDPSSCQLVQLRPGVPR